MPDQPRTPAEDLGIMSEKIAKLEGEMDTLRERITKLDAVSVKLIKHLSHHTHTKAGIAAIPLVI